MSGPSNEQDDNERDDNAGSSNLWGEPGTGEPGPESDERVTRDEPMAAGADDVDAPDGGRREPFPGEAEGRTTSSPSPEPAGPQVPSTPPPPATPEGPQPQAPSAPQMPYQRSEDVPTPPFPDESPRLERSRRDRWIAGVLGGFAAYFGVDATLVRIVVIVLLFATGFVPVVVAYVVALVVMPEAKPGAEQRRRTRGASDDTPRFVLGGLLVAVGALMLVNSVLPGWIRGEIIAPLALIAIGAAIVVAGARR